MSRLSPFYLMLVCTMLPVMISVLQETKFAPFTIFELLWPQREYGQWDSASPTTNCTEWRKSKHRSIAYNYGVNTTVSGAGALLDCLIKDEDGVAKSAVEEIRVIFPLSGEPAPTDQPILDLVKILPNLKTIKWPRERIYHPGRSKLLDQRETQSSTWTIEIDRNIDPPYFIECNSDELDVYVSYDGLDTKHKLDFVFESLSSCANILSLDLAIAQGGCTVNDQNPKALVFGDHHRFLSELKELKISGYDWNHQQKSWLGGSTPTSVESWKSAMNWNRLETLSVDLPPHSFLEAFQGQLKGLKSFSLRPRFGYWGDDETLCLFDGPTNQTRANYTSFIAAMPPLESLSIGGLGIIPDLEPILKSHGNSLRKVVLHEHENACNGPKDSNAWFRPTLSDRQLQDLNNAAPRIETLELDIARHASHWPESTFKILSEFRNLHNLTLHFDLEDSSRTHPVRRCALSPSSPECFVPELMEPMLSVNILQRIFRELLQNQDNSEGHDIRLQWLHAYTGNYGRQAGGGYRFFAHDEHNVPQRFACRSVQGEAPCEVFEIHENPDDSPLEIEVKVGSTTDDVEQGRLQVSGMEQRVL